MNDVNITMKTGRLTDNVAVKELNDEKQTNILSFSIAVNRSWWDDKKGEWVNNASFFNAKMFSTRADLVARLTKGTRVMVTGSDDIEKWTDKDQVKHTKNIIKVDKLDFLVNPPKHNQTDDEKDAEMSIQASPSTDIDLDKIDLEINGVQPEDDFPF